MTEAPIRRRPFRHRCLMQAGWIALALAASPLLMTTAVCAEALPFEITVDGQRVDGSTLPQGATDQVQGALDIQVKFDGLGVTPLLNVSTVPPRAAFKAGDDIEFLASFNYAQWIDRGEVRIYKRGQRRADGLVQTLAIDEKGLAHWLMPIDAPRDMEYVLRVYDADGRFDETLPLPLSNVSGDFSTHDKGEAATAPGYSEDRTALRNIDVSGGSITVYGKNVPADHEVRIAGELVPVDAEGGFVVQRIFPTGQHQVDIKIEKDGEGLDFSRAVEIPETEWFYVGLADFTAQLNLNNHVEDVRPGEFGNDLTTKGRLAFYVKGKIKGRYILTAAADTSEKNLKSIFKGLDEKDPRQFLKRIDPDDYYPVYGDDSTTVEDAPTQGKFYVKLERGPSHVMWGNFKANITGSKFLRNERALYGGQLVYRSNTPAPDGGAVTSVDAHAALPGSLPQNDLFRGTGGSAYFLKHQDISPGSDTVAIETRNAVTGWVISRSVLKYGIDYDLDYVQGVIILRQPLASSSSIGSENYLVASYEFTPAAGDVNGYVVGGRVQQWLGDHLRVGLTGQKENTKTTDQKLVGADVLIGNSDGTYVEAEIAQSQGPGFGSSYSPDGGLSLQNNGTAGTADKKAKAYRIEGHLDLEDITDHGIKGKLVARYEKFEKGYSSPLADVPKAKILWGVEGDVQLSENVDATATYSEQKTEGGQLDRQVLGKIRTRLSDELSVETYGQYTEKKPDGAALTTAEQGKRADVGVKLLYAWNDDSSVYVFGQGTVKRSGTLSKDNRVGLGGKTRLSEKVTTEAEVSTGTQGLGALWQLNYEPTIDDRYYIAYHLDPQRDTAKNWPFKLVGSDFGTIVTGARHRFNKQWSIYAEDSADVFGQRRSLTQAYGVTFTPDALWSITAGSEIGQIFDNTIDPGTGLKNADFDRFALSAAVTYHDEDGVDGRLKGEWRNDNSQDNARDLQSYLIQSSFSAKASEDWRAIASLDAVFTNSTSTTKDSAYVEGSLGFAYRAVDSDRFNALAKYTYLHDNPGTNQVSVDGTTASPAQQSHIFSADASYDLVPQLTIGAKYGARIGRIRERVAGADWEKSSAHLAILRADLHIVHQWDALLEGRILWSPTSDQTDIGAVVALYRHFGDNLKVGVGYNFGHFSDDLRDLSQDDQGVFMNVIGKF